MHKRYELVLLNLQWARAATKIQNAQALPKPVRKPSANKQTPQQAAAKAKARRAKVQNYPDSVYDYARDDDDLFMD